MAADSSRAPALAPPPGNPRFPLLDAMRGIAAALIVVVHVGIASGGTLNNTYGVYLYHADVGVTLFFLISGFLLYRPFIAARLEGRPPIRIRDFARRRILRIVPAYWVALTLLAVWPGLVGLFGTGSWRYYGFVQDFSSSTVLNGDPPAWSLGIEITYYLALPFLAAGLARLSRGAPRERVIRRELVALGALATASILLQGIVLDLKSSLPRTTLPLYFDWFAYGMILAVLSVAWHGRERESRVLRAIARRPWLPWAACVVAYWAVSTRIGLPRYLYVPYSTWTALGGHALYAACAALLLVPAVFCDWAGGWPRRLLAAPALAWLGLVSYGLFLYHLPLLDKLQQAGADHWIPGSRVLSLGIATAVISVPVAAASYYVVERPALRFKDRRVPRTAPQNAPSPPGVPDVDATVSASG